MSGYNSCMFAYGQVGLPEAVCYWTNICLVVSNNYKILDNLLQTGSGKTYTMMGEIDKMDGKLNEDCGITPRVFEYLFSRITKVDSCYIPLSGESYIFSCTSNIDPYVYL